jgi:hypothetical protein
MDDRERAFAAGLVQPDSRSCGASALVVARLLEDEEYAAWLAQGTVDDIRDRFRSEVLTTHRRTNRPGLRMGYRLGPGRLLRLPWPRALGTQPWAAADQLSDRRRRDHRVRWVRAGRRETAYDELVRAVRNLPAPVYVGSPRLPRHVVLAIQNEGPALRVYDPASGHRVSITRTDFAAGKLRGCGGWPVPWAVVTPRESPSDRRTRA